MAYCHHYINSFFIKKNENIYLTKNTDLFIIFLFEIFKLEIFTTNYGRPLTPIPPNRVFFPTQTKTAYFCKRLFIPYTFSHTPRKMNSSGTDHRELNIDSFLGIYFFKK